METKNGKQIQVFCKRNFAFFGLLFFSFFIFFFFPNFIYFIFDRNKQLSMISKIRMAAGDSPLTQWWKGLISIGVISSIPVVHMQSDFIRFKNELENRISHKCH